MAGLLLGLAVVYRSPVKRKRQERKEKRAEIISQTYSASSD